MVRSTAGTVMSNTVPPAEGVPPLTVKSGLSLVSLNVTIVLGTYPVPVKCNGRGTDVNAEVGDIVAGLTMGFITVNGREPLSAPAGSLKVTGYTIPSRKKLELRLTDNCVVFTNVVVIPVLLPKINTFVLGLKFTPVTVITVVGAPTITAAGVSEPRLATAGGCTSVS